LEFILCTTKKNTKNSLVENEAEEEEEEGHQAGLGDFGFGVTSNFRENNDEQVNNYFRFAITL
jgi:hypothetical protein